MHYRVVRAEFLSWVHLAATAVERGLMLPFHAVLGDPPYGLGFMNARWDTFRPERWQEDNLNRRSSRGSHRRTDTSNGNGMAPAQMWAYQAWVTAWAAPRKCR